MPVSPAAVVAAVVTAAVTAATVGIDEGPLDEEEDVGNIRDVDELGLGVKHNKKRTLIALFIFWISICQKIIKISLVLRPFEKCLKVNYYYYIMVHILPQKDTHFGSKY